jgi:putative ABC transport system permease protein
MFKHLLKMIWNKKKQNFLLMFEMLISFLVLFAVFTLLVHNFRNYMKPMGLEYENVWVVTYSNALKTDNKDSLVLYFETLKQTVKALPKVKEMAFTSSNTPFVNNTSMSGITQNNQHYNSVNWFFVDNDYKNALGMTMVEGRWFGKQDIGAQNKPVVINNTLKEEMFGKEKAVGKLIGDGDDDAKKLRIIGVVADAKFKGDYTAAGKALFNRADTNSYNWLGRIVIKVTPDADATFEGRLYKTLAGYMKNANVEIEHLTNNRKNINYMSLVPMIVLLIVSTFLMINVAMGLFGVLWYNINKRRGEIGLRRAIGASGQSVSGQLVSESLILATFSLIVGTFFAVQFPLLNVFDLPTGVYLTAILLSILFIYGLVFLCSLYPGRQAAAIYPAVALHED